MFIFYFYGLFMADEISSDHKEKYQDGIGLLERGDMDVRGKVCL